MKYDDISKVRSEISKHEGFSEHYSSERNLVFMAPISKEAGIYASCDLGYSVIYTSIMPCKRSGTNYYNQEIMLFSDDQVEALRVTASGIIACINSAVAPYKITPIVTDYGLWSK